MFKSESSQFKEQLATVSQWFQQWTDCEQTIALCTLLKQLDSRQARFIEQLLQDLSSTDPNLEDLEQQANSIEFVQSLDSGKFTQEELIQQLLKHFPLLHPGNDSAKSEYLKVIPKAFSNSVANGTKVEDCRKLLTYTLVHPAVSTEERSKFTKWLEELEQLYSMKIAQTQISHSNIQQLSSYAEQIRLNSNSPTSTHSRSNKDPSITLNDSVYTDVEVSSHHLPLHATSSAPPYGSNTVNLYNNNHRKLSRTRSYANQPLPRKASSTEFAVGGSSAGHWRSTPAASDSSKWMLPSQENASPVHSDHGALSPQSSLSSTDSDHEGVKTGVFYQENSGMKEFPAWLKSLRLHKYSPLFENVPYEDMLQVDSKWLEDRQVTKGARNKLAQSIAKLRERTSELRAMEANVVQGANLKQVLLDLKAIVHTPIKPYLPTDNSSNPCAAARTTELADNDLPGLINKLTGRLCTQLLVNNRVEDECYPLYIQLIDKCLHHEAFTVKQRKLLQEWRCQVVQRNSGRMITGRQELRVSSHRPTSRTNSWNQVRQSGCKGGAVYAQRAIQGQNQWNNSGYEKKPLGPTYSGPDHLSVPPHHHLNKSQVSKSAIHRTQSAPIRAHQAVVRTNRNMAATEPEINERLDSLARSMTEAALSSQDSVEHDDGDKEVASN